VNSSTTFRPDDIVVVGLRGSSRKAIPPCLTADSGVGIHILLVVTDKKGVF